MPTVKTAISLDQSLFERSEQLARELKLSRSGLIGQALEEFIAKRRNRDLLARLNQAYADVPATPRPAAVRAKQRKVLAGAW